MISVTSGLSPKLYLNRWCIIKTSWGLPQKSLEIFGLLRKFSEILEKCSGTFVWSSGQFWKIFGKSSESGQKSSENHQKRSISISISISISTLV